MSERDIYAFNLGRRQHAEGFLRQDFPMYMSEKQIASWLQGWDEEHCRRMGDIPSAPPPLLTAREYFAAHAAGPADDANPVVVGESVGLPPPKNDAYEREWFLWWRKVEARWKVHQADALIEALNDITLKR